MNSFLLRQQVRVFPACSQSCWRFLVLIPLCIFAVQHNSESAELVPVGVSRVDITPEKPVHLINELSIQEMAGVSQRLFARALAMGSDQAVPNLLISIDAIGVPADLAESVALSIKRKHGIPREKIVLCATHTHWAPHLTGLLPTIYGEFLPADQQRRVDVYTKHIENKILQAVDLALKQREPAQLALATGKVTFAANRRLIEGGRVVTDEKLMFTYNPAAPVDHSLPVLFVSTPAGKIKSILFLYACHNVALTGRDISGFRNRVHGDWVGLATEMLERRFSDCVALAIIGCGGDQRPSPVGGLDVAQAHARSIYREILTLKDQADEIAPSRKMQADIQTIQLPLTAMPDENELTRIAADRSSRSRSRKARGFLAQRMLQNIRNGKKPAKTLTYPIQVWTLSNNWKMIFLAGEVTVEYALIIKQIHEEQNIWIAAYANATPCYIPSRRLLQIGGYEAGNSMNYYGLLRYLAPETENIILQKVNSMLGAR